MRTCYTCAASGDCLLQHTAKAINEGEDPNFYTDEDFNAVMDLEIGRCPYYENCEGPGT